MAESSATTPTPAPTPTPAATPQPAPAVWSSDSFRILLFGMAGVGKSSLLGALAEVTQNPKQVYNLNGRLIDKSGGGLAELQRRLYVGPQIATAEEVVRYQVEFEPFVQDRIGGRDKYNATLIDCDGRIARELLTRRQNLTDNTTQGSLAREVVNADTLVLVVDSSAPAVQNDNDFNEFGTFLRLLERCRGQRSDIGGLPVFLVLTKVDILAKPDDTASDWYERIEERKRQVNHRFNNFMARREAEEGPLPFGRIDFRLVWATAVKRPALTNHSAKNQSAKSNEPFGVAELFRQCLESAKEFSQRRRKSGRKLVWTAVLAAFALLMLTGLAAALYFGPQDPKPLALEAKIGDYRAREGQTPSARLREPLQPKISELSDLKSDDEFAGLPEDMQRYVSERLEELKQYKEYKDQVERVFRPLPNKTTDDDLRDLERAADRIQIPQQYRDDWEQTDASLLVRDRRRDIKMLRDAVVEAKEWFQTLKERSADLLTFSTDGPVGPRKVPETWIAWHGRLRDLLHQADRPPFAENELIPESKFLTWRTVLAFNEVAEARSEWNLIRLRLERVRDMSAALGLAGTVADRPAVLAIPKPPNFTLADAASRFQDMERAYPNWRDFSLTDLPDNVPELFQHVAAGRPGREVGAYEHLLEPARALVLKRLQDVSPDGKETLARWRSLRPWLENPDELASWRGLARALGRITNPNWSDPVGELVSFINENRFRIEIQRLKFQVPATLAMKPGGQLKIYHSPPDVAPKGPAMVFEVVEDIDRPAVDNVNRKKLWTLKPVSDQRSITYEPGDNLWANLPVTDGDGEWTLTWARARSLVWQFERLTSVPQKHRRNEENREGNLRPEVYLVDFIPERAIPMVPALVPVVRLDRR